MAMTVTKSWSASPYDEGLGVNTPLGTGFVRRVSCVFDGAETGSLTKADVGGDIVQIISIIMKSTSSVYAGTVTSAAVPLVSAAAATAEVLVLVRGL